ncbi:aminoglycoside adenylyltransferase family protein [Azospirillum brasilense]|nr:aminoglycoside adenylyltransferase family protein [Azospirillum brasilense]
MSFCDAAGILIAMIPSLAHEPRSCEQTVAAAAVVRDVLGGAASAAYLYGSAVAGGLRPNSDLDILVVTDRSLSDGERVAIIRQLLPISGSTAVGGPGRPIELTILARPALIPWRHPGALELQYGEWMRVDFERGDMPEWPYRDPDVAVLIETARCGALPLFGPPVDSVLDPVPHADLVQAMVDMVPILIPGIEEGDDRRNGLLTLARIWTTLTTGEILPKDQAADWALARLPEEHRRVLAHARAAYLGEEREDWSGLVPRVRPHVDHVIAHIRTLS